MSRQFHFISGLPRSGSTLLATILSQNPRFHAGISSPIASFAGAIISLVSVGSEWSTQVPPSKRRDVLRGLFHSYYGDVVKPVVFDTNRIWASRLPTLLEIFPDAKLLACVRNVGWIMDSIERVYRANPLENTRLFSGDAERATVYTRVEALGQRKRLVGMALDSVREAYFSEQARSMLLIDYDLLATQPADVMNLVYAFLGEEPFAHDFENLNFETPSYDEALGLSGLHTVRPKVGLADRPSILPPELFDHYARLSFWTTATPTRCQVIRSRENKSE